MCAYTYVMRIWDSGTNHPASTEPRSLWHCLVFSPLLGDNPTTSAAAGKEWLQLVHEMLTFLQQSEQTYVKNKNKNKNQKIREQRQGFLFTCILLTSLYLCTRMCDTVVYIDIAQYGLQWFFSITNCEEDSGMAVAVSAKIAKPVIG